MMRPFDLAVLVLYLVGTLALGLWVGRRNRSPRDFMAAGGRIPTWAVGISIFGTYVSSISFLALPGKAYAADWNPFVFSLSLPLAAWIATRHFVPYYRASETLSAYEHLERRFGPWARTYALVCYLLTQITRMGTIMYLLALALSPLTGWKLPWLILLTGGVVIIYTLYGGMEAVIWTDVVQSFVLIGGALACVGLLLFGMPQGPGQLFEIAREHNKFSLGAWSADLSQATFWVVLAYGLFINLQNFGIDQTYVQRYHTARSTAAAARSVWTGALLYLPISAVFLFIGTGLYAFYTARPDLLSAQAAAKADAVFPHFIVTQLPVGVTGLVIAAIFAAAQSTLSSSMNCCATLVLCDIYQRYFHPGASQRESLWMLRATTLVAGLLGTGVALAMMRIESALYVWWDWAGIFSGGMLGLFLLGLISRRARNADAALGVLTGVLVIVWMTLSTKAGWPRVLAAWKSPFHSFLTIVFGTASILLVGLLMTRVRSLGRRSTAPV
ncbi:MAG: sodium:solute symporter [Verrucomicrobiales bacterium]|nr:sodium:solute symporter [Verrucomicrobiales bacterium]